MNDLSDVAQPKILMCVQGLGTPVECPNGASLPATPEGCESRQIIDHGAVTAILQAGHFDLHYKLRAVHAYAQIWGIEIERVNPVDFASAGSPPPQ